MRALIMAAAALGLLAAPALAAPKGGESKMGACAAQWREMSKDEKAATTYRAFSSACMKGDGPAAGKAETAKADAGGTEAKADTAAAKPAKRVRVSKAKAEGEGQPTAKPADATAQCRDDTYSSAKSHAGACAGHGGVASWL